MVQSSPHALLQYLQLLSHDLTLLEALPLPDRPPFIPYKPPADEEARLETLWRNYKAAEEPLIRLNDIAQDYAKRALEQFQGVLSDYGAILGNPLRLSLLEAREAVQIVRGLLITSTSYRGPVIGQPVCGLQNGVALNTQENVDHWNKHVARVLQAVELVKQWQANMAKREQMPDGIEYRRLHEFGESHLYPPLFVVAPQTSFANAWEVFCCDVINRHAKTTKIHRRKPPESGVDLYWRSRKIAYQCKSVEESTGRFNISKAVASLQSAMKIRETLPWKKYVLCSNVDLTGSQGQQLRAILPDIELLTPGFWLPRCQEQSELLGGRFQRMELMGDRHHGSGN